MSVDQSTNLSVVLAREPVGLPVPGQDLVCKHLALDIPSVPLQGGILVSNMLFSLDPFMRGRMNVQIKSYIPPFSLGQPINNFGVARVIRSDMASIPVGAHVHGYLPFQQYALLDAVSAARLTIISDHQASLPPSTWLGAAGLSGFTAYVGIELVFDLHSGQTIFISAAAGGVGIVAIQLAKRRGLRVIASCSTDANAKLLRSLGADHVIQYNRVASDLTEQLSRLAPIHIYWDNVGGPALEAFLEVAEPSAKIIACGMMSQMNRTDTDPGVRNLANVVRKRITMKGFIVSDHLHKQPAFLDFILPLIRTGDITFVEEIIHGLASVPEAFTSKVLQGKKCGKVIVEV